MDFSNLQNLAKEMQENYSDGLSAIGDINEQATQDMTPDHDIEINIKLQSKVEGKEYKVDSKITFEIELEPILNSQTGDLSSLLDSLDVDLGDDKDAVMEQLGQPRAIGRVKEIDTKELIVSNPDGKVDTDLNRKGTILATINKDHIEFNFESTLSYPDNTDLYISIPSMQEMQKNIQVPTDDIDKKSEFKWTEKDKDNLKVEGDIKIKKL